MQGSAWGGGKVQVDDYEDRYETIVSSKSIMH